ncbi:MAG: ATP-binding protein [Bacteroidales bacterium]|nr:ATP-binding protein [Bacteroidales bacterium]
MNILRRKIDQYLKDWYSNPNRKPLIVKGARQIGKTFSILRFANATYPNVVYINFALEAQYLSIFADGYDVDTIVKNITFTDSTKRFIPRQTIIVFDELQKCPDCATSLKSFMIDGRYDVICSGSLMGIFYQEIESNSVGYKEDYEMHSLDFEEFLWAKGYDEEQIGGLLKNMVEVQPLTLSQMNALSLAFRDYMVLGGMPAIVSNYIESNSFTDSLKNQRQLLTDYEEDITKYALGLDKGKIQSIFRHIPVFLGKENKKFQISKIAKNARNRDYIGTVDWLHDAGIANICYNLDLLELPLRSNYNPQNFKLYFQDTGLLIGSLEEGAQRDLRFNRNLNTCKGALYENIVADMLYKAGFELFYYKNEKSTVEIDFIIRDEGHIILVEVKANDNPTPSLNNILSKKDKYPDIGYGIKLGNKNIGFNGLFYTFPYFLTFLLKPFVYREKMRNFAVR